MPREKTRKNTGRSQRETCYHHYSKYPIVQILSRPSRNSAACTLLIFELSTLHTCLKAAAARFHDGLVSPGAPLGSASDLPTGFRCRVDSVRAQRPARTALPSPWVSLGSPRARENSGHDRGREGIDVSVNSADRRRMGLRRRPICWKAIGRASLAPIEVRLASIEFRLASIEFL